jgi:predicted TIM-barrel fold metal-dependent hydrolase
MLAAVPPAFAASDLPIYDMHMHYSRSHWDTYSPAQVLEKMDKAGVVKALASSTPDDGTLKLRQAAPEKIFAGFRPYQNSGDLGGWISNPRLLSYAEKHLAVGSPHVVFGEIHILRPDDVNSPLMSGYLEIVAKRKLYFHTHSDAAVVRALLKKIPNLKIIWAHAGFFESAPVVGELLDRHTGLWVELSYRARDILPGEKLDPEWEKVLVRHADRFVIGSDTWEIDRWRAYEQIIGEHRAWLAKLPRPVAEKIAYLNAERLLDGKN